MATAPWRIVAQSSSDKVTSFDTNDAKRLCRRAARRIAVITATTIASVVGVASAAGLWQALRTVNDIKPGSCSRTASVEKEQELREMLHGCLLHWTTFNFAASVHEHMHNLAKLGVDGWSEFFHGHPLAKGRAELGTFRFVVPSLDAVLKLTGVPQEWFAFGKSRRTITVV